MAGADYYETLESLDEYMEAAGFAEQWAGDWSARDTLFVSHYDQRVTNDIRQDAYAYFTDRMESEYGIMWEDWFDWDAYREWYDAA